MTKRRYTTRRVSFDGFATPVRHAHWGYLAGEAYNIFTKKQKMAPINKPMASKPFHDESYGGIAVVGESWVKVNCNNRPLKRVTRNNITYRDQYGCQIDWLANTSKFTQIYALGTKEQYITVSPDTQVNRAASFYQPMFKMNPEEYGPGGSIVTAGATSGLAPVRDFMGMSNSTVYLDFLNHTTLPCFVKVHWFKCLKDTPDYVGTVFNDAVVDSQQYNSNWTPAPVLAVTGPLGSGNENLISNDNGTLVTFPTTVTATYTNLLSKSDFRQRWKKLKTKTFTLQNGASHRMTVSHVLNMFQQKTLLDDQDLYLKGSLACIVECQGAPSHLRESIGTPTYDGPTIGPGKISVVVTRKVNIKPMKSSLERYDLTYQGRGNVLMNGTVPNTNVVEDIDMMPTQGEILA